MINNIEAYLTPENIYIFANWGVLPFWLMLLTIPSHSLTKFFVHSIVAPLILGLAYIFITYKIYLNGNIFDGFSLYFSLDNLYSLYSEEEFLVVFWLHFLSISLFIGSWIARDSQRYLVPKILSSISLILTYFAVPVGLTFYWFIRIFFARKIGFND